MVFDTTIQVLAPPQKVLATFFLTNTQFPFFVLTDVMGISISHTFTDKNKLKKMNKVHTKYHWRTLLCACYQYIIWSKKNGWKYLRNTNAQKKINVFSIRLYVNYFTFSYRRYTGSVLVFQNHFFSDAYNAQHEVLINNCKFQVYGKCGN